MQQPSKALSPSPGNDAAADPSPSRGTEGSPLRCSDPELVPEVPKDSRPDVILDSGAALHATARAELLSETNPLEGGSGGARFPTRVGEDLPVVAVGCLATEQFVVPDVHSVPGLGHGRTLISVRQLAARGLAVTFGSDSCNIKEESTGNLVGEGRLREEDGFYYLDYLRIPQR